MKVLVITNDLPPRIGGIQYYVDQLCTHLADSGDEVILYGSNHEGAPAWDHAARYEVVRERTSMMLPTPVIRRRAAALVKRLEVDVVVFGAAFPLGLMGPGIRRRTGVPYIAFTHGLEVSAARTAGFRRLLRRVGRDAAAVTYVSHWCQDLLQPAFGDGPVHVLLPPAVDPAVYHSNVDGAAVREHRGIGEAPLVVCVSRLVERKGQDRLIAALSAWRERVPGTRLMVVGDGPFRENLELQARQAGYSDEVVFTGLVTDEDLPAHFAAGDVFAMPCRERHRGLEVEAFGIVFIQAQAVGVPVVAGNVGGVQDTLLPGTTGMLVDGTDQDAVTATVGDLLADPQRRGTMGRAAARWVTDRFTWSERTHQLRALLDEVVAGRAPVR